MRDGRRVVFTPPVPPDADLSLATIAAARMRMQDAGVDVATTAADPITQFQQWYGEVVAAGVNQPDAMALATVDADGRPEVRHVLLKGVDARGFSFFTNYESDKARQITAHADVSVVFPWLQVNRQVRVSGVVTKLSAEESDDYWATRPRGSQIGARASEQSRVIPDRAWLDDRVAGVVDEFGDGPIPRPAHWGGYLLLPVTVELWQGRADRLHDRVRYRRTAETGWLKERLAP